MPDPKKITALKAQKIQNRVNVYLDDVFAFGLDLENIYKYKLKVGLQLTKEQIDKILKSGEYSQILEKTIKFISHRPRSEKEIHNWFSKRQAGEILKQQILEKLKKLDLINDEKFIQWWVEQRTTFKPRGKQLLKAELLQKGVNKELIEQELTKLKDQTVNIQQLVVKKLKSLSRFSPKDQTTKIRNFLLRKGYSYSEIKPVIDDLLNKT